ncbi:MAG: DNA primase [Candidatus Staskawiczbacteria bacterium]|nr:DNA primase [Candidatus Staskawiczbacteria bacterium]
MDSQIEEIKNKLSVIDVVGSYLKLTKTGINYRGVCPFHSEKSPSFFVSPTRQMWHCFGCGAGSSIFDFVMKIEGVEFGDALRILAAKAGIELKRENVQLRTERQRLYEICELATKFYEKQLEGSAAGKEVQEYLLKRGINKDSIKKWRVGYSPDTWNSLTDFLVGKGYQRQEVIKAGLAIEKEGKNDSYDRFRGRIIFPVFDLNGQPVGFGGRVFKQVGETAKYINTPQTLLYDKSGVMYGLNNAKLAVRKKNQCVVTEGYTDVIMCHQAGFENTVAASGTALTSQHLTILKRYSENLVLAFDMDVAGDSATKRGISLAQEQGFNIKIIEHYGEGDKKSDPADIILKDAGIWKESVEKAKSIMDYYVDSAFSKFDKNTPEDKKEISKIVLPAVKLLSNKIEQSYWVQKLSGDLGINEEAIVAELAKIKVSPSATETTRADVATDFGKENMGSEGRKKMLEEKIISLILKNPEYIKLIELPQYALFSEKIQHFLQEIKDIVQKHKPAEEGELKKDFKTIFSEIASSGDQAKEDDANSEFKNFIAAITLTGEVEFAEDGKEEMELCLLQLKTIELKTKLNKISEDIKEAENNKDSLKVSALVEEFNTLSKEL